MKRMLILAWCVCNLLVAESQVEFYPSGNVGLIEANYFNPSWAWPDSGVTIALASLGNHQYHSGVSYRDLIFSGDQGLLLDPGQLAAALLPENQFQSRLSLGTLNAVYRKDNVSFGFSHEMIVHADLFYPAGLVDFYNQGNQPFIGETIDLAPSGEYLSYNVYALQLGIDLGAVRLAIRPKLLFGHQLLAMDSRRFSVYTDPEFYEVEFDTDFEIYARGLLRFDDLNLLNYNFSGLEQWSLFSKNSGFALDLGATMALGNLQLGLGLIDVGKISWKNTDVYESNKQFKYSGISISNVFDLESVVIGGNLDTLRTFFDFSEKRENIKRPLPMQLRASALYAFSDAWAISTQIHYREQNLSPWSFALIANYRGFKSLEASLVLAYRYDQIDVGLGVSGHVGKFRPFLAFENILQGFNPLASTRFYFRAGINVALSD